MGGREIIILTLGAVFMTISGGVWMGLPGLPRTFARGKTIHGTRICTVNTGPCQRAPGDATITPVLVDKRLRVGLASMLQ